MMEPKNKVIWIDAICINQDDISERDCQVLLMSSIYRSSKKLIVWVGFETNGSAEAFKIFEEAYAATSSGSAAVDA